ncbi:MAG: energy transducer TonB [Candidatus Sulfotelmatobacter sp.]
MLKTIVPKTDRTLVPKRRRIGKEDYRQRELMVGSLCLLLLALGIVLWHDRDFWFPDSPDAEFDQPAESSPVASTAPVQTPTVPAKPLHKTRRAARKTNFASLAAAPTLETTPPPVAITSRTVLPPLEVEVVAGDSHRVLRPGSDSVHVDLQPGDPPQPAPETTAPADTETAANVTSNASERVQMSANASAIVTSPVKPSYPLLARQMKVQGSVILKALIGKDGIIQNLRVVSGPHILASAAQDAVRQWHFKPHLEGSEAVETEAKITVNFTISTN